MLVKNEYPIGQPHWHESKQKVTIIFRIPLNGILFSAGKQQSTGGGNKYYSPYTVIMSCILKLYKLQINL